MEENFFTRGNGYEKWIWIELIGFDNTLEDFGVADSFRRSGFVPDGVSLLLFSLGFVLRHEGLARERPLEPCEQSYGGHEYSPERRRQPWTNLQLKRLITVLQGFGCQVYLSYFNLYQYRNDRGQTVSDPYFDARPFLMETRRDGASNGTVAVLKRLEDGAFFEDVLQRQTVRVLVDYGFDGVQIADGISSPRLSLEQGDYSDDMVSQFLAHSGLVLPPEIREQADGDPAALCARADWIWQGQRRAWIDFHGWRWEGFFRKYAERLHAAGKTALFNSAWTRDPFEALYRYGVDYRRVARTGLKGCMVEDVSAGLSILSRRDNGYLMTDGQRRRVHYEFLTALMLNRAAMAGLALLPLAGIHDTLEQWGVLEHMPTAMTRNVMTNLNTFAWQGGRLRPVTDGPFFCLADGLRPSDWKFIRRNWDVGWTPQAAGILGATLLWSDGRMDREMDAFIASRRLPTHRIVSELLYAGAPIGVVARCGDLAQVRGALLITNADLLDPAQRQTLLDYDRGPVLLAGGPLPGARLLVREDNAFGGLALWVMHAGAGDPVVLRNEELYDFDPREGLEPLGALWTHPLSFPPVSGAFWAACAAAITRTSGAPAVSTLGAPAGEAPPCKAIAVGTGVDTLRVFLGNDDYYYNHATVEFSRPVAGVTCLTKYEGYDVERSEHSFTARVPGRGMEAFDVAFSPREDGV